MSASERATGQGLGWAAWESELTDALTRMADGDILIVELAPEVVAAPQPDQPRPGPRLGRRKPHGGPPYLQIRAFENGWLHMEASSNDFLAPQYQLNAAAITLLAELGWAEPTRLGQGGIRTPNFFVDRQRSQAGELAELAVASLTTVFGVGTPTSATLTRP